MMDNIRLNLADPTLFGNDAAEDEQDDVFDAYYVSRPEEKDFQDAAYKFRILRAYRGEGKSAILRKASKELECSNAIVARTTGSSIVPDITTDDPDQWTRGWKIKIFALLANEIGSRINMAFTDDAISLVEEAENNGFKSKSFVSAIFDRLKSSAVPIDRNRTGTPNPEKVLSRWVGGRHTIWLLVDDIDENFRNTPTVRTKVASFFSACRQIVNLVPEIRIRTGIRPNVWSILNADAESLSKVEQYVIDLTWNADYIRSILAKRIEGFLARTKPEALYKFCNMKGAFREENLITLAFEEKMPWGYDYNKQRDKFRLPHKVLSTLSRNRPRWMIEIVKAASKSAVDANSLRITKDHITKELGTFGKRRIDDLSAEYISYCPQVKEIINAFANQTEDYTTADLHTLINNRILPMINISISGATVRCSATEIAGLLYEIGFLTAREDLGMDEYKHYAFSENPDLLHTRTNLDRGFTWEIHPVFRQALGVRTLAGDKISHNRTSASKRRKRGQKW